MSRVKRMVRWGVARRLIPADSAHLLEAVEALEPERDGVRETEPIEPVERRDVDAILPHVQPTIRAMIELQWFAGMRPGEVIRMTTGQIDRKGDVWTYRPAKHKTRRRGKTREVYLGPEARAILTPLLKADPDAPIFSPRDSVEARMEERKSSRQTPHTPSSRARKRKRSPSRAPRLLYDKDSYARAIRRACNKADVPIFGPNRLRHAFATRVRHHPGGGLEASQVLLGHSKADVTQVYAKRNEALARQVIEQIG